VQDRLSEVRDFVREVDRTLHRSFEFRVDDVSDSGSGGGQYTMVGHAAVFNRWSLDLGGFRERVKKGAFDEVLSRDPHVLHTWDHDTALVLSSTRNKTLELSVDPKGLRYWSKVAPTSYAADLRVLLERGDINQSSFAFTVDKDQWVIREEDGEEIVERTIIQVGDLFDVTTCAMGAYPTTDADLALRTLISGRTPVVSLPVAPLGEGVTSAAHPAGGSPKPLANGGSATRQAKWLAAASALLELRADMETLPGLVQMYEMGEEFIEDEDQPEDAADRAAMQAVLDQLEALIEAEAAEPNEPGEDEPGETEGRRVDTANAREIGRLRREAEAAVRIANERLYRKAVR
jgi:HK97 family phage prohead protease